MIEEANWLTLPEDIQKPGDGFDAVICLGNSFAHLPDFKGTWEIKGQGRFLFLNVEGKILGHNFQITIFTFFMPPT